MDLAALRRQREEISKQIEKASKKDLSYQHNDMVLRNLECELERLEQLIREYEGDV
jgi:uncharacterized protein involved in exopolysaccharide biosynthesis